MDIKEKALQKHYEWRGKIEVIPRMEIKDRESLALAYTPGVAQPCLEIAADYDKGFELTRRGNIVAVVTDGTAVLGLGDIGPAAAMPVMEGKAALFKEFAGVDAFPICIDSKDTDTIVETVALISKSFGGINLEDIAAPRCFEIERKLKERCDIPVFHDDQHGTAIVVAAALKNAMKVTGKRHGEAVIAINGAGAAGSAIAKLIIQMGFGEVIMLDIGGALCRGDSTLSAAHSELAAITNPRELCGGLSEILPHCDVFIGVSRPGLVTSEMVSSMKEQPIVFAMANPVPEIMPDLALKAGAAVVGTGRSDFPNQINNVLAFPGVFKGALAVRARDITDQMKAAAADAIADLIADNLSPDCIIPDAFDTRVADAVADAVAQTARDTGFARK